MLQALVYHIEHACVDALVQDVAVAVEGYLYDVEGAPLLLVLPEGGVGLSRHVAYLQCVHHTAWILLVHNGPVLGIEQLKLLYKAFEALVLKPLLHPLACLVVDGWYVVDAVAHSVDVHHRAACKQCHVGGVEQVGGEQVHNVLLVHGGTVVVVDVVVCHKEVLDTLLLYGGRGGSADRYLCEYLSGVGIDDRHPEMLCHL